MKVLKWQNDKMWQCEDVKIGNWKKMTKWQNVEMWEYQNMIFLMWKCYIAILLLCDNLII